MTPFTVEHRFSGPAATVVAVLLEADFHASLEVPDVALVERPEPIGPQGLRLRYEFVGELDPLARRLLAGRRLTWTQHLELDRGTGAGHLRFAADADPRRLHGDAAIAIDDLGGAGPAPGGSRRRIDGGFTVVAPVVGRTAERRLLPGLLRRLELEAAAVEAAIAGR